ncbi:hypothetical protein [Abyssibius alkaniclasticus]|uniref:hypothetical protein n=1 Tax=Abyssibius alkaniclasticus TaxID=2881234 RepID=UPI0040591B55
MQFRPPRAAIYGVALLILAACDIRVVDNTLRDVGTYYDEARPTPENGALVALAGSFGEAFARVERNLRAASFQIVSSEAAAGVIVARSTDPKLVACGELLSGPPGQVAPYKANAPLAMVEVPGADGGATFVRREFTSASEITIRIGANPDDASTIAASISELHNATIRMTQLSDNAIIYDETVAFYGTERARFSRGVVCGSARGLRAIIRRS